MNQHRDKTGDDITMRTKKYDRIENHIWKCISCQYPLNGFNDIKCKKCNEINPKQSAPIQWNKSNKEMADIEKDTEWSCVKCTFRNAENLLKCSMCSTSRYAPIDTTKHYDSQDSQNTFYDDFPLRRCGDHLQTLMLVISGYSRRSRSRWNLITENFEWLLNSGYIRIVLIYLCNMFINFAQRRSLATLSRFHEEEQGHITNETVVFEYPCGMICRNKKFMIKFDHSVRFILEFGPATKEKKIPLTIQAVHDNCNWIDYINVIIKVAILPDPVNTMGPRIGRVYSKRIHLNFNSSNPIKMQLDDYFIHQGNIDEWLNMAVDVMVEITDVIYDEAIIQLNMKDKDYYELICTQNGRFYDVDPCGLFDLRSRILWDDNPGPAQFIYYIGGKQDKPEDNFAVLMLNSVNHYMIKILKMPPGVNLLKYQILKIPDDDNHPLEILGKGLVFMDHPLIDLKKYDSIERSDVDDLKQAIIITLAIRLVIWKVDDDDDEF